MIGMMLKMLVAALLVALGLYRVMGASAGLVMIGLALLFWGVAATEPRRRAR